MEEERREVKMRRKREGREEEKHIRSCHEAVNIPNRGGILEEEDKEEE